MRLYPTPNPTYGSISTDPTAPIRLTDTDASLTCLSAVQMKYLEDPYIQHLVPRGSQNQRPRPPLINFGTWVRTWAIDALAEDWIGLAREEGRGGGTCQIVSLGAGSDTRFWRLANRIIWKYAGHEHHFIRVAFCDEGWMRLRWDREVDGRSFLRERIGGILKTGFKVAGRLFELLAYSTSARRLHSVWFMNPFRHDGPNIGVITTEKIRDSIGEFYA